MIQGPLSLIGNTPLVKLAKIAPPGVEIYAKMESENLTGSIKARTALSMIEAAEASSQLRPGARLIEPTSGNTGIALAAISGLRGYSFTAVVSRAVTDERIELLEAYGAEIIYSAAAGGSNEAIRVAETIANENPELIMLDQYSNPANPAAHYNGTAREILAEIDSPTSLVAGLGTGGTLVGCSSRFREESPGTMIVAVEPMPGEEVQGLRSLSDGYIPAIFDSSAVDRKLLVRSAEAIYWTRRVLREEGLFIGVSAGSNIAAAIRLANPETNSKIVVIIPDGGSRYLSTGIFSAREEDLDQFDAYGWW